MPEEYINDGLPGAGAIGGILGQKSLFLICSLFLKGFSPFTSPPEVTARTPSSVGL